jgi:hypothetical protein
MHRAWLLVLALTACGSPAHKSAAPAPRPAPIDCHVVAEHGVGVQSTSPDLAATTKATVAASCARTGWSEETKRCIVENRGDCNQMLTTAQHDALQADLAAAFAKQPGVTVTSAAATK